MSKKKNEYGQGDNEDERGHSIAILTYLLVLVPQLKSESGIMTIEKIK